MKYDIQGDTAFLIFDEAKVKIDTDDLPRVLCFRWYLKGNGYVKAMLGTGTQRWEINLHQLILSFPEKIVDHINRNPLDNRKINLRIADKAGNRANSRKNKAARCKFRGVYARRDSPGKYRAAITIDSKVIGLGTFKDEIEAAKSYDKAASAAFGEFARLNFPTIC